MRLIDADALTESMKWSCEQNCQKCIYQTFLSSDIHCGLIDEAPTIEAVPMESIKRMVETMEQYKDEENKVFIDVCIGIVVGIACDTCGEKVI